MILASGALAQTAPDYQDDRSTPEAVISSHYNAINRHEFVRGWSYWRTPPDNQTFDEYQAGYAGTASVELQTGTPYPNPGAGQLRYTVPVSLVATQTNGSVQTYVGCVDVYLAEPSAQAAPPFAPMAIESADIHQIDNGLDTVTLLGGACA
jgi:hypothetical protein